MGKTIGRKWYAVACGKNPGIYDSWAQCQDQVKGFKGAVFKSFPSKQEAQEFCGQRKGRTQHGGVSVAPARFKSTGLKCTSSKLRSTPHPGHHSIQAHSGKATGDRSLDSGSNDMVMYFDGGSRGNPGPAGCGAAVYARDGDSTPIATDYAFVGHATNNQAEYEGLILGLGLALQHGAQSITIRGDSMLVVNQVKKTWKAHHAGMRRLLDVVLEKMLPRFGGWQIEHVYRNSNGEADRLANQAMDNHISGPLPSERHW